MVAEGREGVGERGRTAMSSAGERQVFVVSQIIKSRVRPEEEGSFVSISSQLGLSGREVLYTCRAVRGFLAIYLGRVMSI